MNYLNPLKNRLRRLASTRPDWALSVYSKLPPGLKNALRQTLDLPSHQNDIETLERLQLLPLDSAWSEAIFAPFHDPAISHSLPIEFYSIGAKGCRVEFFWCWTLLCWETCCKGEDAAVLKLQANLDCSGFDTLLLCLTMPHDTLLRVEFKQDGKHHCSKQTYRGEGTRMEIELPLGKGRLEEIRLIFQSESPDPKKIFLSWFGLKNSLLSEAILCHEAHFAADWPGLIRHPSLWNEPRFAIGLLFDPKDLGWLAEKRLLPGWDKHFSFLLKKANEYMKRNPEDDLGDYLPSNDSRFLRARQRGKTPYYFEALVLGFVGLVNNDQAMIIHALRYLMCMLHTRHWTQSAESRLTGSTWDQRCFLEELTATSVSLLADWFYFALTKRAMQLVHQSLWDKGLSVIERDLMKYSYLQRINQGSVFCRARILAGLHLERAWPNMGDYVERAFSDMRRNLRNYMEPDGGTHEGIGYFCQTLHAVLPAMIAYSRARDKGLGQMIRSHFSNCENYITAMSSITPGKAIPEGDCRTNRFCGDAISVLARFFPGSPYEKLLMPAIDSGSLFQVTGTLTDSGGITGFIYGPDHIGEPGCIVPTFTILKKTGHMTSMREKQGHKIGLHMVGSKPYPSHSHYDKGAIVLEIDSTPVFIDRGMVEYYFADSQELKRSYMHNVITPVGDQMTYPDQSPPTRAIIPKGKGDALSVHVEIDLTNVWQGQMHHCKRRVDSEDPDELIITDSGRLLQKGRIAFHLHSLFPFEIQTKDKIFLQARDSTLSIEADWAQEVLARSRSIDLKHRGCYHLAIISCQIKEFHLVTRIKRI